MKYIFATFAVPVFAIGLLTSAPASANLLSNGGFEVPAVPPASFSTISPGGEPAGFGWTVTVNNVDVFSNGVLGTTAPVFEGAQALDLVGTGSMGGLAQNFATILGQTYVLSFEYANNPISTTTASAAVTVIGSASLLANSVTHTTSTDSNFDWTQFSETFIADGTTATLAFNETVGADNGGVLLDAVSVATAVPEPASLVLLGTALLGLGAIRRRRKIV